MKKKTYRWDKDNFYHIFLVVCILQETILHFVVSKCVWRWCVLDGGVGSGEQDRKQAGKISGHDVFITIPGYFRASQNVGHIE